MCLSLLQKLIITEMHMKKKQLIKITHGENSLSYDFQFFCFYVQGWYSCTVTNDKYVLRSGNQIWKVTIAERLPYTEVEHRNIREFYFVSINIVSLSLDIFILFDNVKKKDYTRNKTNLSPITRALFDLYFNIISLLFYYCNKGNVNVDHNL